MTNAARKMTDEEKAQSYETMRHIETLRNLLNNVVCEFLRRGQEHDQSKMGDPELALFTKFTPKLKFVEYNSPEYHEFLEGLTPALDNHYAKNSHHPQHYEQGIEGMNLFDLLEMLCDWEASSRRTLDGDLDRSIEINIDRFKISPQLAQILRNTVPLVKGKNGV